MHSFGHDKALDMDDVVPIVDSLKKTHCVEAK